MAPARAALARPRLVVGLGRIAWRELAGRAAAFSPVDPSPRRIGDRWLLPMYHPAYIIRGAYTERRYARDFRRLAQLLRAAIAD